jgi:pimeloyl-ACP methyl ester carboxylesterase
VNVLGFEINTEQYGSGEPLVLLHGEDGTLFLQPMIDLLAETRTVIVPTHPGWGDSPADPRLRDIDDLSILYLELLRKLGIKCPVIGFSLGAWLGAEMATRSEENISALIAVSPVGLKVGDRDQLGFVDLFAEPWPLIMQSLYKDPAKAPDWAASSAEELLYLAKAQESVARYGWNPYLHSQSLGWRLARIRTPVLLIDGESDVFVTSQDYYKVFAERLGPHARRMTIENVGHRCEEEAPAQVAAIVGAFLSELRR